MLSVYPDYDIGDDVYVDHGLRKKIADPLSV